MRQRLGLVIAVAVGLALLTLSSLPLPGAPTAIAQNGQPPAPAAQPLPTIVLDVAPVAQAIQTQAASSAAQLSALNTSVAQIATRVTTRTVTGVGYVEVTGVPDTATAQIDVKTLDATLDAALDQNRAAVAALRQQLQASLAVAADAITPADPQIAPVLGDDRVITGYRVLTPVKVVVPTGGNGAGIIAQIVGLGGSSFKEIVFSVKDPTPYQKRARAQAFQKARAQAEEYAGLAGGSLGDILSVSEDVNSRKEPAPPLPGKPTEQIFSAQVSVVFELKQ